MRNATQLTTLILTKIITVLRICVGLQGRGTHKSIMKSRERREKTMMYKTVLERLLEA